MVDAGDESHSLVMSERLAMDPKECRCGRDSVQAGKNTEAITMSSEMVQRLECAEVEEVQDRDRRGPCWHNINWQRLESGPAAVWVCTSRGSSVNGMG